MTLTFTYVTLVSYLQKVIAVASCLLKILTLSCGNGGTNAGPTTVLFHMGQVRIGEVKMLKPNLNLVGDKIVKRFILVSSVGYSLILEFLHVDIQNTGRKSHCVKFGIIFHQLLCLFDRNSWDFVRFIL